MSDLARRRFAALIEQVEALEEQVTLLQQKISQGGDGAALAQELHEKQQQLAEKRTALTRVSDGCGTGHPKP